jgi:hypothetical protein
VITSSFLANKWACPYGSSPSDPIGGKRSCGADGVLEEPARPASSVSFLHEKVNRSILNKLDLEFDLE